MQHDFARPKVDQLIRLVRLARSKVLDIYDNMDLGITYKEDRSPLTLADMVSHHVIAEGLAELYPSIPVISEEGTSAPYVERKEWRELWLVDPLDGTKEFIKKNGQFCINIGYVKDNVPQFGLIDVPVDGVTYVGLPGQGAYRVDGNNQWTPIQAKAFSLEHPLTLITSRSHQQQDQEWLQDHGISMKDRLSMGSAIKFCRIAEGAADMYLRLGPTMEWDTAAGHAIVNEAGGYMTHLNGSDFLYNKEIFTNPGFLLWGNGRVFEVK